MAIVFVEARPTGRPEKSAITGFAVESHTDHVLAECKAQHEAIAWAKKTRPSPLRCAGASPERQEGS
jgi:hypothetical protein